MFFVNENRFSLLSNFELTQRYGLPTNLDEKHRIHLGTTILNICHLAEKLPKNETLAIDIYIRWLLHTQPNFNLLLAELGSLYQWLESGERQDSLGNFFKAKSEAIENEVSQLWSQLSRFHFNKALLKILANLIIDKQGKVNYGGIYSALYLMEHSLSLSLSSDLVLSIANKLHELLNNNLLVLRLEMQPSSIHPLAEQLVRVDLGLQENQPVTPRDAQIACLIAYLFDLRQYDEPNCYSIGPTIFATWATPGELLSHFQELIQEGGFYVWYEQKKQRIPIFSAYIAYRISDLQLPLNGLQQALIFKLEFLEQNFTPRGETDKDKRAVKKTLQLFFKESILEEFKKQFSSPFFNPKWEQFFSLIEKEMQESLWMIEHSYPLRDKEHVLSQLSHSHRCLAYIKDECFEVIDSFTKFQIALQQIADTVLLQCQNLNKQEKSQLRKLFQRFVTGHHISMSVINLVKDINKKYQLSFEDYEKSGFFMCQNDGGAAFDSPIKHFAIPLIRKNYSNEHPLTTIAQIFEDLHLAAKSHLNFDVLFCESMNHSFILTPNRFRPLFYPDNCLTAMNHLIFGPLATLFSQPLTYEKRCELYQICGSPQDLSGVTLFNQTDLNLTALCQSNMAALQNETVLWQINNAMFKISPTSLRYDMILQGLDRQLNQEKIDNIKNYVLSRYGDSLQHPSTLSFAIREGMCLSGLRFIDPLIIEQRVSYISNLPSTFIIGDLNGADAGGQGWHTNLIWKPFLFSENKLVLACKERDAEGPLEQGMFEGMKTISVAYHIKV